MACSPLPVPVICRVVFLLPMFKLQDSLINVVSFLGVNDANGQIKPKGTAFYVVVPFRSSPTQGRGYLVTAKHNVEMARGRPELPPIPRTPS